MWIRKIFILLLHLVFCESKLTALQIVQQELAAPIPQSSEYGEMEDAEYWETNAALLEEAWNQWESSQNLPKLNIIDLLDNKIREAINHAWSDPKKENIVKDLWTPVAPNIYCCQLFNVSNIHLIREHIDKASFESKIPTRRPNGMNRYGLLLNSEIAGAVNLQEFQNFYVELIYNYIQPIGRVLFPQYISKHGDDDSHSYGFTIRYKHDEDIALKEHSDASLITLNVNLNKPESNSYDGSTLYFLDEGQPDKKYNITFQPGMALIHLGRIRHAASNIIGGERTNMIIWLHGKDGYVRIVPYEEHEQLTLKDRWTPRRQIQTRVPGERFLNGEL